MSDQIIVLGKEVDIVEAHHAQHESDPGDPVPLIRIRFRTRDGREGSFRVTDSAALQIRKLLKPLNEA